MNATLLLLLATIAAPADDGGDTTVDTLKGNGRIVKVGVLTSSGRGKISEAATDLAEGSEVTVVVCTGKTQQIEIEEARRVGRAIRTILRRAKPTLRVSTVTRAMARPECPTGVVLEKRRSKPRGDLREATTVASSGPVKGVRPDGHEFPVATGSVIPAKSDVMTGPSGRVTILLPSGTEVKVHPNSRLSLAQLSNLKAAKPEGAKLKLLFGRMWSRVTKLFGESGADMNLETENAVIGVRGTTFVLDSTEPKSAIPVATGLAVYGGAMAMAVGDTAKDVPAGFALKAKGAEVGELRKLPPAPTGLQPQKGKFVSPVMVTWQTVPGATGYRLEVAREVQFRQLQFIGKFKGNAIAVEAPPGTYFWRVVSFDEEGFESAPSALYRVEIALPEQAE